MKKNERRQMKLGENLEYGFNDIKINNYLDQRLKLS